MNRVLVVCAMNRCRSPVMAYTLADLIAGAGDSSTWQVISRGVAAVQGQPLCSVASTLIGLDRGVSHVATPLAVEELEHHDIILAASRAERAQLAHMAPRSRPKTFTLIEAAMLGRPAVNGDELQVLQQEQAGGKLRAPLGSVAFYAALLHFRRGLVVPGRRQPMKPQADNRLDLPERHGRLSHARVLRRTAAMTTVFFRQMSTFTSVSQTLSP